MTTKKSITPEIVSVKFLKSKSAGSSRDSSDGIVPGLYVRKQSTGTASFRMRFRTADVWETPTLGTWSETPQHGYLTLADARHWAQRLNDAVDVGRAQYDAVYAELQRHLGRADASAFATAHTGGTIGEYIKEFYEKQIVPSRRSDKPTLANLNKDIVAPLGEARVANQVTTRECARLIESIIERGSPQQAGVILALTKQFFEWCTSTGRLPADPAARLSRKLFRIPKSRRKRNLTRDEIPVFWRGIEEFGALAAVHALRLILLTGVRGNELCRARWARVQFDAATWTIPVSDQKMKKEREAEAEDFVIPLPPMALSIMRELKRLAGDSPFVLPGKGRSGHLSEGTLLGVLHRAFGTANDPKKTGAISLPGGAITVHDLRRTMGTRLSELGVDWYVKERCLNHSLGELSEVYDQAEQLVQRRDALERFADDIRRSLAETAHLVVAVAKWRPLTLWECMGQAA